jgi:succinate dehydrogenase flavin-adding protein (antitoxin of CptAB toxin-antitoxin module)
MRHDAKCLVIACQVLEHQISSLVKPPCDIVYLEQCLHCSPDKLRVKLQDLILDHDNYPVILLGFGLCGKAVVGVRAVVAQKIIIPRIEDCIGLLLGSRMRYYQELRQTPGTYFFTKAWIELAEDPLKEYYKMLDRYDEETARWAARESLKYYKRAVFLKTPELDKSSCDYVQEFARFFNLNYVEMDVCLSYLQKLFWGSWDEEFIVIDSGQTVTEDLFFA